MLQTVSRAIKALLMLAEHRDGLTLTSLATLLKSNKATAHRIVTTLKAFDLVMTDGNGKLRLGSGVRGLSEGLSLESRIREAARPYLARLRDATGETACLHLVFGYERACVEQVESRAQLKWVAEIGKRFPLTAGAPGKVILAFMSPEARQRALRVLPLARLTPDSITDPRCFTRALEQARRDGYAISINESVPGAAACAAPVRDWSGKIVGAMTVSGPVERLSRRRLRRFSTLVKNAGESLSRDLRS
jgi:DNA-binding IclR family transcriptional regulator